MINQNDYHLFQALFELGGKWSIVKEAKEAERSTFKSLIYRGIFSKKFDEFCELICTNLEFKEPIINAYNTYPLLAFALDVIAHRERRGEKEKIYDQIVNVERWKTNDLYKAVVALRVLHFLLGLRKDSRYQEGDYYLPLFVSDDISEAIKNKSKVYIEVFPLPYRTAFLLVSLSALLPIWQSIRDQKKEDQKKEVHLCWRPLLGGFVWEGTDEHFKLLRQNNWEELREHLENHIIADMTSFSFRILLKSLEEKSDFIRFWGGRKEENFIIKSSFSEQELKFFSQNQDPIKKLLELIGIRDEKTQKIVALNFYKKLREEAKSKCGDSVVIAIINLPLALILSKALEEFANKLIIVGYPHLSLEWVPAAITTASLALGFNLRKVETTRPGKGNFHRLEEIYAKKIMYDALKRLCPFKFEPLSRTV
jgi:hypothetical protein